jgi:hypothetical protein
LKDANRNEAECQKLVVALRKIGKHPAKSNKEYIELTLASSDDEILALLKQVVVEDESDGAGGKALREKTISKLPIPPEIPSLTIYEGLLGWLVSSTLMLLSQGNEARFDRDQFSRAFANQLEFTERGAFENRRRGC